MQADKFEETFWFKTSESDEDRSQMHGLAV